MSYFVTTRIRPGDLIEWVYMPPGGGQDLVVENELLWSFVEGRGVPIGRNLVHMCIASNNLTYSWLNSKGVFTASSRDPTRMVGSPYHTVAPRVRR